MNEPKDRLRELRIKAGFETVADAARAWKVNPNTLTSHENGNRDISRQAAAGYAAKLGVPAGYLLYGESEPGELEGAQLDADIKDFAALDPADRRRIRVMIRSLLTSSDE